MRASQPPGTAGPDGPAKCPERSPAYQALPSTSVPARWRPAPPRGVTGMLGFVTAPVDLAAMFATVAEPWSPRTVAVMNDYDIRVVRTQGEFTWHSHPETDEF